MGYYKDDYKNNYKDDYKYESECHNHEFQTSIDYKKDDEGKKHNHRISCITGPAIKCDKSHIHKVETFTDTFGDHIHKVCDTTGPAIYLPGGKHIHLVKGKTSNNDGHCHNYYFVTEIQDPTNVPKKEKCCD